jgi:hypothetical protein
MNWISQVRHVAAKDVRHTRWMLVLYAVLLTATTASIVTRRALGPYATSPNSEALGMREAFVAVIPFGTVILGLIGAALLLQMDSPTRANAFWASRPLSPAAVLGAKLVVVAAVIVAFPVIAGSASLLSFGTSLGVTTALTLRGALGYGELLLAVIVISALADDMRETIVTFTAIVLGGFAVLGALDAFLPSLAPIAVISISLLGVIGALAIARNLYRTREKRLRTRITGIAVVACLLVGSFNVPASLRSDGLPPSAGPAVNIEAVNPNTWGQTRQLSMRLRPGSADAEERLEFRADSITLRFLDGKRVPVYDHPQMVVRMPPPPVAGAVRWIVNRADTVSWTNFSIEPSLLDRPSIARGVASVVIKGTVIASRPQIVATLPLRNEAVATDAGRRVRIYGVSHDATGADVWVQISAIPRDGPDVGSPADQLDGLQFAIVNEARGEAIVLNRIGGGFTGGSGSIVLPWIPIWTSFTRLSTGPSNAPPVGLPLDDAWYAGAHLVVAEWNVIGRYRTRGEVALQ